MTSVPPETISWLERGVGLFLRPTLQITRHGPRIEEEVAVHYSGGGYDPFHSPGSTATVQLYGSSSRSGRASYIRAWVHNLFGFPARRCQVYVDSVRLDGTIIEFERSPLHWADLDGAYELPMIRQGYRNGHYIDICSADSIDPRLQLLSQKGLKGYHRFRDPGIYTLELTAEGMKPCSFGKFTLTISHDGRDWEGLRVLSAEQGGGLLRWF